MCDFLVFYVIFSYLCSVIIKEMGHKTKKAPVYVSQQ
nr:MAG TPA: hypothetical protein [Caudoviricetes sp.]